MSQYYSKLANGSINITYPDKYVGIGTTNPSSKLHIVNSASSAFLVNTGAGTGYTYLRSTNTGGEFILGINRSDGVLFSSGLAYATSLGTTGSTALQFHTNNNPRVTVDTSGNVGIGTTDPNQKLEVFGNQRISNSGVLEFFGGTVYPQISRNGTSGGLIIDTAGGGVSNSVPLLSVRENGGTDFVTVLGSGNVGIGTASPGGLLHLHSDGGNACGSFLLLKHANNNNTDIIGTIEFANNLGKTACIQAGTTGHCQSGYMSFSTELSGSASEVMRITEDSKVGIGLTNPASLLTIADGTAPTLEFCRTGALGNGWIKSRDSDDNIEAAIQLYDSNIRFYNNNNQNVTINSSGCVGIGTTNPDLQLHVKSSSGNSNLLLQRESFTPWQVSAGSTYLTFLQYGGSELVRIQNTGNVGIGTASPERKLHVFKGESGGQTSNSDSALVLENSSHTYLQFLTPSTVESGLLFGDGNNDVGALVYDHADDDMRFIVNAGVKAVIDSNGKVGIGTTDPDVQLSVYGADAEFRLQRAGGSFTGILYQGFPSGLPFIAGDNELAFGGAGAWTEHMRITSGGNVGIGTASPSAKLDVRGSAVIGRTYDIGSYSTADFDLIVTNSGSGSSIMLYDDGTAYHSALVNYGNGILSLGLNNANSANSILTTTAVNVTSTGVGIGTASPVNKLNVCGSIGLQVSQCIGSGSIFGTSGSASWAALELYNASNGYTSLNNQNYGIHLCTNSNPRLTIKQDGTVGIGTTDPSYKLDIDSPTGGGIRLNHSNGWPSLVLATRVSESTAQSLSAHSSIYTTTPWTSGEWPFNTADGEYGALVLQGRDNGNSGIVLRTGIGSGYTNGLVVRESGNVGIGTTSPGGRLEVALTPTTCSTTINETADFADKFIISNNAASPTFGDKLPLVFNVNGDGVDNISAAIVGERELAGWCSALSFWVNNTTSSPEGTDAIQERMRLCGSGQLRLHNYGSCTFSGTPTHYLTVDSSGNVIEELISSGTPTGSGTTNYIPKWTGAVALGNSTLYETSAGYVGIGTTDPNDLLHIQDSNTGRTGIAIDNTSTNGRTYILGSTGSVGSGANPGSFIIRDGDASSNRFVINSSGQVGIGTTSPITKLNIKGDQSANGQLYIEPTNDSEYAGLVIKTTRGADRAYAIFAGGTGTDDLNFRFRDASAGADRMVINSSGNVGIGTTNPSEKLHLYASLSGAPNFVLQSNAAAGQEGGGILFKNTANYYDLASIKVDTDTYTNRGDLVFATANTSTPIEAVRILGVNQNVGIGTTSPASKLDIQGSTNSSLILTRTSSGIVSNIEDASGYGALALYQAGGGVKAYITGNGSSYLLGGNVGIGTTDPNNLLSIRSSCGSLLKLDRTDLSYGGALNFACNNTQKWVIKGGYDASCWDLTFLDQNDTSRLTITQGGLVGIGTYRPTVKLEVKGDGEGINLCSNDYMLSRIIPRGSGAALDGGLFSLFCTGTECVRIDGGGNSWIGGGYVGIGTNVVSYPLEVTRNNSSLVSRIYNTNANGEGVLIRAGDASCKTRAFQVAATDDTKRFTINSDGTVGIGITNPTNPLEVQAAGDMGLMVRSTSCHSSLFLHACCTGTSGNYIRMHNQANCYWINHQYNGCLIFRPNATGTVNNQIYFNQNSCVGIGTDAPSTRLDVVNTNCNADHGIRVLNSTANSSANACIRIDGYAGSCLDFARNGGDRWRLNRIAFSDDLELNAYGTSGAGSVMYWDYDTGNVGIGTAPNASFALEIHSDVSDSPLRVGSPGVWSGINFCDCQGSENIFFRGSTKTWSFGGGGSSVTGKRIHVDGGATIGSNYDACTMPTDGLLVEGAVGIGITNPSQKLHVVGKALITDDVQLTGSNPRIDFNTNGASSLRFYDTTNTAERMRITGAGELQVTGNGVIKNQESGGNFSYLQQTSSDSRLYVQYSQPLLFGTAATERMRIAADGKVGIGTTGFGTNTGKLFVGGYCADGSSAIAQFNGFIRADRVITHTAAGAAIAPNVDTCGTIGTASARFANVYAVCTTTGAVIESNLCSEGIDSCPRGSVVVWRDGKLQGTTQEYDHRVMGITAPGSDSPIVMGAEPILVTGDIEEGDPIVTSSIINHGMKGDRSCDLHGRVIGEALESGSGDSYTIMGMVRKF